MASRSAIVPRPQFSLQFADGQSWVLGKRTRVMGILNVTPDSFSDGGRIRDVREAVGIAGRMVESGVDIVDVGGESTRPGAGAVTADEEARRVLPVVEALKSELGIRVSVDTAKSTVAARAIESGADVINDVTAGSDPEMFPLLAAERTPVVLMHMRGTPRNMQSDTRYDDVLGEVVDFLRGAVKKAASEGVADDKIVVDPGIGFGKSPVGNLQILRELATLGDVGRPILVGASRKSFIGSVLDLPVTERLEGSLSVAAVAAWQGAHIVRAHDVQETVRVVRMVDAIRNP